MEVRNERESNQESDDKPAVMQPDVNSENASEFYLGIQGPAKAWMQLAATLRFCRWPAAFLACSVQGWRGKPYLSGSESKSQKKEGR
jgi:hypothetical protein